MDVTMMRPGAVATYAGGAFVLCAAAIVATALGWGAGGGADADSGAAIDSTGAGPPSVPPAPLRPEPGVWPRGVAEKHRPGANAELGPPLLDAPVLAVRLPAIRNNFGEGRGGRRHEGVDIMAPRGTPALAAVDGWVWRMKWDQRGGRMLYLLESSRQFLVVYAHLDAYASDLAVGQPVRRGEVVGFVGETGNVSGSAHLHLSVERIRSPERWWDAEPVDPYPLLREAVAP